MTLLKTPKLQLAKKLNIGAIVVSIVVLLLVGAMRQYKIDIAADLSFLPAFHAVVNALTALVLIAAFYFIKNRRIQRHKQMIYLAFVLSVLFLLSYVGYHFTTPETIFGDLNHDGELNADELAQAGGMRSVYLIILLTHITLAAVSFPFILFTFIRAYTGQYDRHRRMARWVFPIWLYVAITGPIVYMMIKPYYP